MSIPNIDINSLIPHHDRIKMISNVLEITPESAVAEATVNDACSSFDGQSVSPIVMIEVVVQTGAIIDGYKRRLRGKTGGKGWLVGVKNASFNVAEIPLGTQIATSICNSYSFGKYSVIKGAVKAYEEIVGVIVLQDLRMNEDPTKDQFCP